MITSLRLKDQHLPQFGKNWWRFSLVGVSLILLGMIAIAASTFTTLLSVVFLGFIILLSGGMILIDTFTFWRGKWGGFTLHLIMSLLYIAAGFYLIQNPVAGSVSITLLLGIFYLVIGIARIISASGTRVPNWGWKFFNGAITLLIGTLILLNWPAISLFMIGLFVGIDLIFCGWYYIMFGSVGKRILKEMMMP